MRKKTKEDETVEGDGRKGERQQRREMDRGRKDKTKEGERERENMKRRSGRKMVGGLKEEERRERINNKK